MWNIYTNLNYIHRIELRQSKTKRSPKADLPPGAKLSYNTGFKALYRPLEAGRVNSTHTEKAPGWPGSTSTFTPYCRMN